jgi:hypothetical protein
MGNQTAGRMPRNQENSRQALPGTVSQPIHLYLTSSLALTLLLPPAIRLPAQGSVPSPPGRATEQLRDLKSVARASARALPRLKDLHLWTHDVCATQKNFGKVLWSAPAERRNKGLTRGQPSHAATALWIARQTQIERLRQGFKKNRSLAFSPARNTAVSLSSRCAAKAAWRASPFPPHSKTPAWLPRIEL